MLPNSCRSCRRTRRCQRWSGRCWRRCATRRDAITRSAPRSSCSPTSRTPGAAPHLLLLPLVVFHGPVRLLCPSRRHLRVRSMNQAVRWHVHLHCRPFAPAHAALFGHHRVGAAVAAKAEARLAELQQSAGARRRQQQGSGGGDDSSGGVDAGAAAVRRRGRPPVALKKAQQPQVGLTIHPACAAVTQHWP